MHAQVEAQAAGQALHGVLSAVHRNLRNALRPDKGAVSVKVPSHKRDRPVRRRSKKSSTEDDNTKSKELRFAFQAAQQWKTTTPTKAR